MAEKEPDWIFPPTGLPLVAMPQQVLDILLHQAKALADANAKLAETNPFVTLLTGPLGAMLVGIVQGLVEKGVAIGKIKAALSAPLDPAPPPVLEPMDPAPPPTI